MGHKKLSLISGFEQLKAAAGNVQPTVPVCPAQYAHRVSLGKSGHTTVMQSGAYEPRMKITSHTWTEVKPVKTLGVTSQHERALIAQMLDKNTTQREHAVKMFVKIGVDQGLRCHSNQQSCAQTARYKEPFHMGRLRDHVGSGVTGIHGKFG